MLEKYFCVHQKRCLLFNRERRNPVGTICAKEIALYQRSLPEMKFGN
jgi:hypothetical protein